MIARDSLLVQLLRLVDRLPHPAPSPRRRGRPTVYSNRLLLKALVVMLVRHIQTVAGLLVVWEQPTAEMQPCCRRESGGRVAAPGSDACKACRPPCAPRLAASVGTCCACSSHGRRGQSRGQRQHRLAGARGRVAQEGPGTR